MTDPMPAQDAEREKKWYVIQARTPREKEVVRALREHISQAGMEDKFGRLLVPTESVVEMFAGRKRRSERRFFPGYVLVEMDMDNETWNLVRRVPNVLGFLGGTKGQTMPAPLSAKDISAILERITSSDKKAKPKVIFEPGELVRVIDGPFSDFSGVVEDVNYDRNRLRVSVSIFSRSTPVELDFGQVEKS